MINILFVYLHICACMKMCKLLAGGKERKTRYISDTTWQQESNKKCCAWLLKWGFKTHFASWPCSSSCSWSVHNEPNVVHNKIPGKDDGCPVDDLEEGDEAEAKTKSKEAAKWRDELDRSHSYSPLHLCYNHVANNDKLFCFRKGLSIIVLNKFHP